MWWWKQKKILLDHPYFDCHSDGILSRKEVERIYKSGFPTFKEMIDGAKDRFDLPKNAWHHFDEVISSRAANHRGEIEINFFAAHKRLAVALMIILIVISFFTLVPFGRALAADFFNMIMRVIDGRIEITSEYPDYEKYEYVNLVAEQYNEGDSEYIEENVPISYPNIEAFISKTGLTPITITADWFDCQTIQSYEDEEQGLTLTVQYLTSEDLLVMVTQRWNTEQNMVVEIKDTAYNSAIILDNTDLLYAIDPIDGSFNGTAILDDSLLIIGAEKGIDINKLLEVLK